MCYWITFSDQHGVSDIERKEVQEKTAFVYSLQTPWVWRDWGWCRSGFLRLLQEEWGPLWAGWSAVRRERAQWSTPPAVQRIRSVVKLQPVATAHLSINWETVHVPLLCTFVKRREKWHHENCSLFLSEILCQTRPFFLPFEARF